MALQRKLARLEGFKPLDEQEELRTKIDELQKNLNEEVATNALLVAQFRKLEVCSWYSVMFSCVRIKCHPKSSSSFDRMRLG